MRQIAAPRVTEVMCVRRLRLGPRRTRQLGMGAGLVAVLAVGIALVAARVSASTTVTLTPAVTNAAGELKLAGATYATAKAALTAIGSSGVSIPVVIPDLQALSAGNAQVSTDDTNHSIAIQGDVTIKGITTQLQLSAVWGGASTPQLALAVKPGSHDLAALNGLWANAPFNPTLSSAIVLASPSPSYVFDSTKLPAAAQAFYGSATTASIGQGMSLLATIDASSDAGLTHVLGFLGEGTTVTLQGTASHSIAPLFGGATPAQQSGLDLTIADSTVGAGLPSWITARTSTVELQLTAAGGGYTASAQLTDTVTTSLSGKTNTFVGTTSLTAASLAHPAISATYGLQSGTTLQPPFGLGPLSLSSPQLSLSYTAGGTPAFAADLAADVSVNSKTIHVDAAIGAGGGGGVTASLSLTGSVTTADAVAVANSLLGTSVDSSSLGTAVTLTGVTFSLSSAGGEQDFSLSASATVRSLAADVLVSVRHKQGAAPTVLVGLHLTDAGSSCKCITVGQLFGGTVSALAGDLQIPAIDVMGTVGWVSGGQATTILTSALSSAEKAFLAPVYPTLPASITFQPGLTLASQLTVPDAVASAFGMTPGATVQLTGDVGANLGAFSGSGAPALTGSLTAALPTMTATLPSWLGGQASAAWTLSLKADSQGSVQLDVSSSAINATVGGTTYPVTVDGTVGRSGGHTLISLTGTVTATISNLFGISWLSVTNPAVALTLDSSKSSTSFSAMLDATVTVAGKSAQVTAAISKGDGTDASLDVSLLDPVSLADVASTFGSSSQLSSLSDMPSLTVSALDAHFAAGSGGLAFELTATTTLTIKGNPLTSNLLVSASRAQGATHIVVGMAPTGQVKLSDVISSLPGGIDFTFPQFAVVLAHPALNGAYSKLSSGEQNFFAPFCADATSPCNSMLGLADGLTIVAGSTIPTGLQSLLSTVNETPPPAQNQVLVSGTLPIFSGDPSAFSLTVALPNITATASTPELFERGGLSLVVTDQSLSLDGTMTFNIPKGSSVTTSATCTTEGGIWRVPRDKPTAACYDQVPFDLGATIAVTPVPTMTLHGGLHQGYSWVNPLGATWLSLTNATIEFGVAATVPGPTISLGFNVGIDIATGSPAAHHDLFGAFLASVTVDPLPPFLVPNLEGFRVQSTSGLSMQDVVDIGGAITGTSFSLGGVPNLAVRKIDFGFSEVDDPVLCLQQGIHIAGDLYINPPSAAGNTPVAGGCPTDTLTESSRSADCQNDAANGCFASVDLSVDKKGIIANGSLSSFGVGPVQFGGAKVNLALTASDQHLALRGAITITGFASGSADLLISTSHLHFRGAADIFAGAFQAFLDADASYSLTNLTSLKSPPGFHINAVLKSDFLNSVSSDVSLVMQKLKPAITAIDTVLTDVINGNYFTALTDVPVQVVKLGVSLPSPYGPAFQKVTDAISSISSAIDSFGHAVSFGLDDVLNGFDLSFPGLPGTIQPPSDTCVGAYVAGTCYGFWIYPTCITTTVNGVCYSVPPITGVHIPGICDGIKALVPGLTACGPQALIDQLIKPALTSLWNTVTGMHLTSLGSVLDTISNALGSGTTFAIDCAQFTAFVDVSSSPSAGVTLSSTVNLLGSEHTFGIGWNFAPNTSNVGSAIVDILNSIIHPVHVDTCGLPADWNTNPDFPDVVGTGTSFTGTGTVTTPPPPTMSLSAVSSTVTEGSSATVTGSISPAPAPESVSIIWGDGSTGSATTLANGSFTTSHQYLTDPSAPQPATEYQVTATAGSSGPSQSTVITVNDAVPSAIVLTPSSASVDEGSPVTLNGSFVDPGTLDSHTVTVSWGDGRQTKLALAAGATTFAPVHTYVDNNGTRPSYPVSVTVSDDDNASATQATAINVRNVAPRSIAVVPISCTMASAASPTAAPTPCTNPGAPSTAPENANVTYSVSFADPGINDTETVSVDWGDGTTPTTIAIGTNRSVRVGHEWSEADRNPHPAGSDPSRGMFPVAVTVTDKDGGTGTASATQAVLNVTPTNLTEHMSSPTINEGQSVIVSGSFIDNSGADSHTVAIDWGAGWGATEVQTLSLPVGTFTYTATRQYGDNGSYTVGVTVTDDDGASTATSQVLTVNNVTPSAVIGRGTTTSIQGVPTQLAHVGVTVPFAERTIDPGSDDETIAWNWADGTSTSTTYLVNPPAVDPPNSPSVQPRDITSAPSHSWAHACFYSVGVTATDDDRGVGTDHLNVIVTGNDLKGRSSGWWANQFKHQTGNGLDRATLACYLQIVNHVSAVPVLQSLTSNSTVQALLHAHGNDARGNLNAELLTAWLNFSNGAVDWNTLMHTGGGHSGTTVAFHTAMAAAEAVAANPSATAQQLSDAADLISHLS